MVIDSLTLDGSLRLSTLAHKKLLVRVPESAPVVNQGHEVLPLEDYATEIGLPVHDLAEVDRMRGYKIVLRQILEAAVSESDGDGDPVFTIKSDGSHGIVSSY